MPELPEVQTTVNGLQKKVVGEKILDVWTDLAKKSYTTPHLSQSLKDKRFFARFRREVRNTKVVKVERRAKNILMHLSNNRTILIHMKMTGHLMVGKYRYNANKKIWLPDPREKNTALRDDPFNKYLHVVFSLSGGKELVFSDARKFGKVTIMKTAEAKDSIHLGHLGPEPLDKNFGEKEMLITLSRRPGGKIKQVLMDQSIISGIGNIYSDEMLWLSGIHPFSQVEKIPKKQIHILFLAMKNTLRRGIDFGGDSTSDYRDINGNRGKFQHHHNVYQKTGKPCMRRACRGVILRKTLGGRSAHFCSRHQKLFI